MLFYDWLPNELPKDAVYYYNILLINIAISPQYAPEVLPNGTLDLWYLEELLSERPYAVHFFVDIDIDDDHDYELEMIPHCVIETHPTLGPSWYKMIDFITNDPWRIEPEYDDEYEDEEY